LLGITQRPSELRQAVRPPTEAVVTAGDTGPKPDDCVQQFFSGMDHDQLDHEPDGMR
jgi:hypothetical protein